MRSVFLKTMVAAGLAAGMIAVPLSGYAQGSSDELRVNLTLKDADMLAATKALTSQTGLQFVLEPSADPYPKVTLQLNGVTAEEAISYICQAAGARYSKDENGVYVIGHKKLGSPSSMATEATAAPPTPPAPTHVHKFKLMHADAKSVLDQLGGKGPGDPFAAYEEINRFSRVVHENQGGKVPASPIYMLGTGPDGTAFQPVSSQTYSSPKTFQDSGSEISLPGESANQFGVGGGGGGFGGGQFGGGGGGIGGGGVGGLGGGAQGGRGGVGGAGGAGGAGIQSGIGLIPQVTYITFDPTDNSIIIQGTDEDIRKLQDAITFFDVAPQQVTIKVEFITTTNDFTSDLGFDWTYARGNVVAGAAPGFFTNQNAPIFLNWATGNIVTRLRAELNRDTGKTVQAPVIRTLNNEPASVENDVTTYVFYNQTISIGNGNVITQTVPTSIPVDTLLSVKPRINNDGTITVYLTPSISDIAGFQTDPSGNQYPEINTQSLEVVARVKSGETIALAGFTRKSETGGDQRFPILGELPLIGQFFRHTSKSISNSELIIFVTPTIIDEDQGGLGP